MAGRTDTFLSWLVCVALAAGTPLSGAEPRPAPPEPVDTVVVRPAAWAEALQPWKAYREAQGHRIAELDSAADSRTLRAATAQGAAASTEPIRYVPLAGDVSAAAAVHITTCYYDSSAMSQFGGDATIASDNPYADLDGDNVPELAIGRIPADSAEQLKKVLARVMATAPGPAGGWVTALPPAAATPRCRACRWVSVRSMMAASPTVRRRTRRSRRPRGPHRE